MQRIAKGISVDAGLILVADISYAKDVKKFGFCKKELDRLGKTFDVPNGFYKVKWSIPETYEGDIEGHEELEVTGGKVFVCDPCYPIGKDAKGEHDGNKWGDWLNDTDFANNLHTNKAFTIGEMGGDGCYDVTLEFEKIM